MTYKEFLSEVEFELSFVDVDITMSGPADKIMSYYTGDNQTIQIASWQPVTIRDLVNRYVEKYGTSVDNLTEKWFEENV